MVQQTKLTKQEIKISKLASLGMLEKEIADTLCISTHTVHTHLKNIRKKTGARNMVDIARNFILSLENPKHFFKALLFLVIQFHILFSADAVELRKQKQTRTRVRVERIIKTKH